MALAIKRKILYRELIFLAILTGLIFLPFAFQLTYHRDDWYYVMDRLFGGPKIFHTMFEIDRPLRGYFFEIYYSLFGISPLAYNLGALLWKWLASVAALWLFRILWPTQSRATFLMAFVFAIYPGYLNWVAGVEFQPMIASLAFQMISFALTAQAIMEESPVKKWILFILSIITGWVYIGLVDYALGMEVLRFGVIYLLLRRQGQPGNIWNTLVETLKSGFILLLISGGFLIWKLYFFENQRKATSVTAQLKIFLHAPVATGLTWLAQFSDSVLNVAVYSWIVPFYRYFVTNGYAQKLAYAWLGMILVVILVLFITQRFFADDIVQKERTPAFALEAIGLGLLGLGFGVLPVVLANRAVDLKLYSYYGLPASLAASILIVGLIYLVKPPRLRMLLFSILIAAAVLTHYGLGQDAVDEEASVSNFWQQMAWRAPGLQPKTTLAVSYAGFDYADDSATVWGPANDLYFPDTKNYGFVNYPLSAISFQHDILKEILQNTAPHQVDYRTHIMKIDYASLLVISQPTIQSCVHVLDQNWPEISVFDRAGVQPLGAYSHVDQVMTNGPAPEPARMIFGSQPPHGWCYAYEKAELARQQGNWAEVVTLAAQAQSQALSPSDPIEWMPFLQAYAYAGDLQHVKLLSTRINTQASYKKQACSALTAMAAHGYALKPEMLAQVQTLFCGA